MSHNPPPRTIPLEQYEAFTHERKIPVEYTYVDESFFRDRPPVYEKEVVDQYIPHVHARKNNYYGITDQYLYQALEMFPIEGKSVGIMGSTTPWYESIAIAFGASPTTIDYNKIISHDPRIQSLSVEEIRANPVEFDALISISSFEHDGLGRYGDPINPDGDLLAMEKAKEMLKPGGHLFLAIPVGRDLLNWNVHRVYGALRLPQLLKGWEVLGSWGFSMTDLDQYLDGTTHQPLFLCKKPERLCY